jgi:hypothetical protein
VTRLQSFSVSIALFTTVVSGKSSVKSGSGCDSQGLYFTLVLPAMRSNYVPTPLVFNTNYYGLECLGGNNPVFAMPSAHTTYPLSFDTTFAFDHSTSQRHIEEDKQRSLGLLIFVLFPGRGATPMEIRIRDYVRIRLRSERCARARYDEDGDFLCPSAQANLNQGRHCR